MKNKKAQDVIMEKPKIVLSLLAQQHGLTVEDIVQRYNCKKEDVVIETEQEAKEAGYL